jgi:hypothetical protein
LCHKPRQLRQLGVAFSPHNFGFIPEGIRVSFTVDEADVQLGWEFTKEV